MRRSWAGLTAGLCVLGALSFAFSDEPGASGPTADEMRALRAENRMLEASVRSLRAEVAKLQAENALLREKAQQAGLPVEPTSLHEPAPTSQDALSDVAALAKLLRDYGDKKAEILTSQTTQAQKEAAYQKARDEFAAAFGRRRVSVAYMVDDVTVDGDGSASIQTGPGEIAALGANVAELGMSPVRLHVRLSKTAAGQIRKNASLVVLGTVTLCAPVRGGFVRAPEDYTALGYLYPDPTKDAASSGQSGRRTEVAVRDGRQFTLEGSRLEVTKVTSSIYNLAPAVVKPVKRPPGK